MTKKFLTAVAAIALLAACTNTKNAETAEGAEAPDVVEASADSIAQAEEAIDSLAEAPADSIINLNDKKETMNTDAKKTNDVKVKVQTSLGDFTLLLYSDTPKHRDNFVKLVNNHTYDGLLFHRVIQDFMVQGGDPDSKDAPAGKMLGSGDMGYTIPAEIVYPKHYHKRGALAAARTGDQVNPERRSSGSQFYVVTGQKFTREQLKSMQLNQCFDQLVQKNMDEVRRLQAARDQQGLMALQAKIEAEAQKMVAEGKAPMTEQMIKDYTTVGGAPHLDGQYTVYGEVISGMETIDKIEKVEKDGNDRPKNDVRIISMKIVD